MNLRCTAAAVQMAITPAFSSAGVFRSEAITTNLARIETLTKEAVAGHNANLVLFPEFSLNGYTLGLSVQDSIEASIEIPGPETERLCSLAAQEQVYLSACCYEKIPQFPGRFFNTNFILTPEGDVGLVYRKLYAMTIKTRPGDVLGQWLDLFGQDSLFPVLETPFGKIGVCIAGDMHWPEMARCLVLKGAEILLNPLGAGASDREEETGADWHRAVRAFENAAFVVCANIGPFTDQEETDQPRVPSEICDYNGAILARAAQTGEQIIACELDVDGLRRHRLTQKKNFVAQLQPHLHLPAYRAADLFPADAWAGTPIADNEENWALERRVAERMIEHGLIKTPD